MVQDSETKLTKLAKIWLDSAYGDMIWHPMVNGVKNFTLDGNGQLFTYDDMTKQLRIVNGGMINYVKTMFIGESDISLGIRKAKSVIADWFSGKTGLFPWEVI